MQKTRVCFIGVGGYGGVVLNSVFQKGTDGFDIVAVADPFFALSKCKEDIKARKIPVFDNFEDIINAGIKAELAVIATPIRFHTEQILFALKHGMNVLCEKPLTGDYDDIELIQNAADKAGKFVAVGFQWSYSEAIEKLKNDISAGVLGKAINFKTLIFWPRNGAYFKRGTGWAGKVYDNGKKILDSILNNATAHFVHNIMYVSGDKPDSAMPVKDMRATLLRTNDIETFDTATVKFTLENGAIGIIVASHCTQNEIDPVFEYSFEKALVKYPVNGNIVAYFKDGKTVDYGDPFKDAESNKVFRCIKAAEGDMSQMRCGINAAKEQVRFIAMLHKNAKIINVDKSAVINKDDRLIVKGLEDMLKYCYENNVLLEEAEGFCNIAKV